MISIGRGDSSRLTPKHRLHPGLSTRTAHEDSSLRLTLRTVIGSTTSSASSFDSISEHNLFVCCAGPAAILSQVDEDLKITQRLFRARPNALPIYGSSSFYSSGTTPITPTRSRYTSSLKDGAYVAGITTPGDLMPDSPSNSRLSSRTREATCVSISPGAKFVAVGETGHAPKVNIFSTAPDAPSDVPVSILADHSFGVQSVAFSGDSRWLCSLGNSYDGFLLLYSISPKSGLAILYSSNKCSNVRHIVWMGNSVISIGTRHVKVWRVEEATSPTKRRHDLESTIIATPGSPGPKTFGGRNCLLGPLMDANFTSVVALSENKAILCTAQGDVCLLDDSNKTQRLERVSQVQFGIQCVYYDRVATTVWIGGKDGIIEALPLSILEHPMESPASPPCSISLDSPLISSPRKKPSVLAIGYVRGSIITIDSDRILEFRPVKSEGAIRRESSHPKKMPAHESAVLGVCLLLHRPSQNDPCFLTFSARGTALFWQLDGTCKGRIDIPLDQPAMTELNESNELRVVVASEIDHSIISADKLGVLRLIDRSGTTKSTVQAHIGDINGIAIADSDDQILVASCGRDRTVQIFVRQNDELVLQQTLDDHAASVGDVIFADNAATLLSISSDRTIVVRKVAHGEGDSKAFIPVRVITLKARPVSFTNVPFEPNVIVVSTMDRQIHRFDISSGRLLHSFKALDPVSNDTVIVASLEVHRFGDKTNNSPMLFGVSSTDKSIRIHNFSNGSLLAREHGQTAISAIRFIHQGPEREPFANHLISCGLDGTVMIWDVSLALQQENSFLDNPVRAESPVKQAVIPTQPLRRILSRVELSELQRSSEGDADTTGLMRSLSPSRIRKQTSRYSVVPPPSRAYASTDSSLRKTSHEPLSTPTSPKTTKSSRSKRTSLDHRHRSKSAANLNDLNDSAELICKSLRAFRKRVTSSVANKVNTDTVQELECELDLTMRALGEKTKKVAGGSEPIAGDLLDVYLAKMIDDRLALRAKSGEAVDEHGKSQDAAEASSGATQVASESESPQSQGTGF